MSKIFSLDSSDIKEFWSENYLPLKENSFAYIESYI